MELSANAKLPIVGQFYPQKSSKVEELSKLSACGKAIIVIVINSIVNSVSLEIHSSRDSRCLLRMSLSLLYLT